ncbi:MAG: hypothetical protein Q4B63_04755 [Clostridium perfringens]|nr:hypothetical protein [Clostridium perfringens]
MNENISNEANFFANLPIGLMGGALGLVILANAYASIDLKPVQFVLMNLGAFLLILGFLKLIAFPKKIWAEVKRPELYSTYIAFPMTVMTVGKFYSEYNILIGRTLWYIGAGLDIFIVLTFLYMYAVKKPKLENISPSWFLLLVGSVVIPASNFIPTLTPYTRVVWLCCFVAYIIIVPIVIYRCLKFSLPKAIYPYYGITSAPASLLTVGYLAVCKPDIQLLSCMIIISITMTLFSYIKLPKVVAHGFRPSFAGYTFGLAISCLCQFKAAAYFEKLDYTQIALILRSLGYVELLIASIAIFAIVILSIVNTLKPINKTI